jgi:hypothetical protein
MDIQRRHPLIIEFVKNDGQFEMSHCPEDVRKSDRLSCEEKQLVALSENG